MTFIITLISLVIERFFHWNHLRHWRWFSKYQRWLSARVSHAPAFLLFIFSILPLLILVGVINYLLDNWLYEIPRLVFGVFILVYCMGPYNLWMQTLSCLNDLHKDDPKIAVEHAQTVFGIAPPNNSQAFHQALTNAIFIQANQRVFAVVFWFVLLGPVGAVLYRSIALSTEQSALATLSNKLCQLLDWLPARVFTFIFALGGHFMDVFALWKRDAIKGVSVNDQLIAECGVVALDVREAQHLPEDGSAEKAALGLLDRVFIMGLVFLAVVVLIIK